MSKTGRLSDKSALSTASMHGIGTAFTQAYVREGAKVCIAKFQPGCG